jgi:hypothetical protein
MDLLASFASLPAGPQCPWLAPWPCTRATGPPPSGLQLAGPSRWTVLQPCSCQLAGLCPVPWHPWAGVHGWRLAGWFPRMGSWHQQQRGSPWACPGCPLKCAGVLARGDGRPNWPAYCCHKDLAVESGLLHQAFWTFGLVHSSDFWGQVTLLCLTPNIQPPSSMGGLLSSGRPCSPASSSLHP